MKLLALDAATEACTVAIVVGDDVREAFQVAPREHGHLLLPMVYRLLAEAGLPLSALDAIAFGRGPGAFTGVRMAVATAQGLALGADLPLLAVSTLATLAQGAGADRRPVLAVIDARMGEVYAGGYAPDPVSGGLRECLSERVCAPESLEIPKGEFWFGAGSGWARYPDELGRALGQAVSDSDSAALPRARNMLVLAAREWTAGRVLAPEQAAPVYLRDQVIQAHSRRTV